MRCKQAEKLILEVSQAMLDPDIKAELDAHVLKCQQCASFKKNLQLIHHGTNKIKAPELSKALLEKTFALCHSEIIGQAESLHPATIKTPKFVWVALGSLSILTIAWVVPVLKEVIKSQIITRQAILIITIIVQNLIMLLFSPVLLRRLKLKSNWIDDSVDSISINSKIHNILVSSSP